MGAGISGLSIARLLKDDFEVEVLEKESVIGGIARTRNVNGMAYHVNGGHCFDSKYNDVKDFVFNEVLSKDNWNFITRKAEVLFRNTWINYPIEFSIKDIDKIDSDLAFNITGNVFFQIFLILWFSAVLFIFLCSCLAENLKVHAIDGCLCEQRNHHRMGDDLGSSVV